MLSVFTFQRQSVLIFNFHSKTNRYWHRINYWFDTLRPNNMSRFDFSWRFLNYIFSNRLLTFVSDVLTVLPWRHLILISIAISYNILRNLSSSLLDSSLLSSSLLHSFLTFLSMFCKMFNHNVCATQ